MLVSPILRKITRKISTAVNSSLQIGLESGLGDLGVGFVFGGWGVKEKQEAAELRHRGCDVFKAIYEETAKDKGS